MEGKQGYLKGMDQDTAFTKRDPNSYFEARNFRVVTDVGSSSGSLENEKGTVLSFKVPDLASMVLTDGTIIPAQAGLRIIGSCTMVDEIIIFTTNDTSDTPSSYGQIWKCKYSEITSSIIGLTVLNELDPSIHLFYNQKLNFSTEHRIGRAIALYETIDKQRVYWTDNYNQVRTFNLAVPNPLDTPLSTVNIFAGVSLTQPVFKAYGTGNLPSAAQVQFTYNLITANGIETAYAPPTPLYPLPEKSVSANTFPTFEGGGTANSKSITYTLNNIDTSYDVIQHIAIVYYSTGVISIYKFAEDNIPTNGSLTVTCSNIASATVIDPAVYSIINTGFDKCKDIEVQGNRLIAANISTSRNDIVFDARAYRFNSPDTKYAPESPAFPLASTPTAPIALLQDSNSNLDDLILIGGGVTPAWGSVPESHDAINITNKEQTLNWFNADQQYKYQSDGVTIGGEGPNVKYEFTFIGMVGNTAFNSVTNAPNHVVVNSNIPTTPPIYKGVLDASGNPQPVEVANQIANMAGPWAHSEFTGYSRGEIYRFAVVLYDKKGVPTFAKWIGDIKFPDVSDGYPLQTFDYGAAILHQLGIKFTVDVSSIADNISGYSIVRLPREDVDKTRLGTGFHMFFDTESETNYSSLMHRYFLTGLGLGSGTPVNDPYPVTSGYQKAGDDNALMIHLSDKPGYNHFTPEAGLGKDNTRIGYLISPFGNLYTSAWTNNDYLETLEYYRAELHNYYDDGGATGTAGNLANFAFYYKMKDQQYPLHERERIQIQKSRDMFAGEVINSGDSYLSDLLATYSYDCVNASYTRKNTLLVSGSRELYPLGVGNNKRLLRLHMPQVDPGATNIPPTIPNVTFNDMYYQNVGDPGNFSNWNGPVTPNTITLNFAGQICETDVTFKSVGYRRYLDQQYKGNTWESRSLNEYIYIGHYQSTLSPSAYLLTTDIYGGDTYVNYYDEENIERYVTPAQNPQALFKVSDTNNLGVAVCGPVESSVNTNWRTGRNWAKDREKSNMAIYGQNSTQIYPIWNQEDEIQRKFFAEDFLSQFVETHPTQLWASEVKLNGELIDNWRSFPIANKTEVDGIHGPINRIISFKNNLLFYQDKALGIASLDEKSVIQDNSGQELVLGVGGVFPDYRYMSVHTGTVHQFSVVATEDAVYHYDARLKKFFKFADGIAPLSDLKGMSSFFAREVQGQITNTDKTLRAVNPIGVHGTYDPRYNRVLYTFLKSGDGIPLLEFLDVRTGDYIFPDNTFVLSGGVVYYIATGFTYPATTPPTSPNLVILEGVTIAGEDFTISFNEFMGAFESFYDFLPSMYLEYGRRLLSVSPSNANEMHTHNVGPFGQYYDSIQSTSKLHTIFSQPSELTKIWNNMSFVAELYDAAGADIYDETLDRMQFLNNYQDTGVINLVPNTNIKRRMRTWRTQIPREKDKALSRMRNPWLEAILEYDNTSNKRHVLHDITYSYTPSQM